MNIDLRPFEKGKDLLVQVRRLNCGLVSSSSVAFEEAPRPRSGARNVSKELAKWVGKASGQDWSSRDGS